MDFTGILGGLAVTKVRKPYSRPSRPIATMQLMYSGTIVPLVGERHPNLLECKLIVIFFQSVLGNTGIDWAAFFAILLY